MAGQQNTAAPFPTESEPARIELPEAPDSEKGRVKAWEEPVEIVTYEAATPDENPVFFEKRVYQGSSGKVYPLPVIDRIETTPHRRLWKALHIENEYIRVMILPEIGGRIHLAVDKHTGYDFIYRQNVIKPALVGLAGPWVSGGIEFNWPQHHRPATYMPVDTYIERRIDGSIVLWCGDHDPMERMKGMHGVCLHPDRTYMEVKVRLYNRTFDTRTFLWWANVATHVNERYQSFFPRDVQFAADHAKRAITSYPLSNGTYYGIDYGARAVNGILPRDSPSRFVPDGSYPPNDLGWYANIPVPTSYMIANSGGDYSGGYDHIRKAGTVAIANHHIAPGKKQWTWGNHHFGYAWDRSLTESDGPYVELMVGAYTDNQPDFSFLAPGETKSFSQYWYSIHEIGVPDIANLHAALRTERASDSLIVHLIVTADRPNSTLTILSGDRRLATWCGDLSAGEASEHHFVKIQFSEQLAVLLEHEDREILRYAPHTIEPAAPPTRAVEPLAPADMKSIDELFLAGLHLEQYRHPTSYPDAYWHEALRRDAGDSRCNHALGRWHLRRGEFDLAKTYLQAAIARLQRHNPNPYDGEPHYNLGLTLLYLGHRETAYDAFYKSTWNAAWAAPAYLQLAFIDCTRGDWTVALDHISRSLNKDLENLQARNLKASIFRRLDRNAQADQLIEETISLDPLDIHSRYLRDGDIPDNGQQAIDLAFDLICAGLLLEAFHLVQGAIAIEQPNATDGSRTLLLYLLASLAHRLSLAEQADNFAAAAASSDTRYVFPHRLEEYVLLTEAIRHNPSDAHAHLFLGNFLYDRRRHLEAIEHWEKATQLDPSLAIAWRNLAFGSFNILHDATRAKNSFKRARSLAPHDARLLFEFDQLCKLTGTSPSDRLALLFTSKDLVNRRDDLIVEMATLLNSQSQPEEALRLLLSRQFQPWEGGEGAVLMQFTRSHLLLAIDALEQQRPSHAVHHMQQALCPPASLSEAQHVLVNISLLWYWLGRSYYKAGDKSKAEHYLNLAASTRGDFQRMQVMEISEATLWSAMALRHIGREAEAEKLFEAIRLHARSLKQQPALVDFFATSLPTMVLFDEDLQTRNNITATFLEAQALIGLNDAEGQKLLQSVLEMDRNHAGAIDMLRMLSRPDVIGVGKYQLD